MNRLLALAVVGVVLLLAGCAAEQSDRGVLLEDPAGDGPAGQETPVLPTGADDVVLRIETSGGFVPVEYAFAGAPTVVVTGDGAVVQPAEQPADAPQPSLQPLVQHTVDEGVLRDVVRLAGEAGLLAAPPDYLAGAPQVTDMPSTTVQITADGRTWTHSAYALGFEEESGARRTLAEFVDEALDALGQGTEPYRPAAVRLIATPSAVDGAEPGPTWPAAAPRLADVGGCAVVERPAAVAAVVEALSGAGDRGVFVDAGRTYVVAGAAVLPGETRPCADW